MSSWATSQNNNLCNFHKGLELIAQTKNPYSIAKNQPEYSKKMQNGQTYKKVTIPINVINFNLATKRLQVN